MKGVWTDRRVEQVIGNMLRAGVLLAALIALAGGAVYLIHHEHEMTHYSVFSGEPPSYRTFHGMFESSTLRTGRGWIMLGMLVLLLTPISRVAFSLVAFALETDWLYVVVTAIVLTLLLFSLLRV